MDILAVTLVTGQGALNTE
uniref:Uncharacterized protein n=1 Tax=Anguilla anguilla TaxID=7936 RepID=A0A0E9TW57_ANGAN